MDRSNWRVEKLEKKVDTHLLIPGFGKNWNRLMPLLNYMYIGKNFVEWIGIRKYSENFHKVLNMTMPGG